MNPTGSFGIALIAALAAFILSIIALTRGRDSSEINRLKDDITQLQRDLDALRARQAPVPAPTADAEAADSEKPEESEPASASDDAEPSPSVRAEEPVEGGADQDRPEQDEAEDGGKEKITAADTEPAFETAAPEKPATSAVPEPERHHDEPPRAWERFLGVQLPVWIGAVVLCVGMYFLVSFSIESGLFGPTARVIAGVVAGLVALIAAPLVRRWLTTSNAGAIAAAIAAAGITALYVSAYAAANLYGLIPPIAGFAAMAAVTFVAISISLSFGRVIVVVALVGGNLTPALFASTEGNLSVLLGYLAAIYFAVLAVARRRDWWVLATLSLAGPALYLVPLAEMVPADTLVIGIFLAALPLFSLFFGASVANRSHEESEQEGHRRGAPDGAALQLLSAITLSLVASAWMVHQSGHALGYWQIYYVLAGIACLMAIMVPSTVRRAATIALIAGGAVLLGWENPDPGLFLLSLLVLSGLFGVTALSGIARSERAGHWAAFGAATGFLFYGLALLKHSGWQVAQENATMWAALALGLAVLYLGTLVYAARRVTDAASRSYTFAALATAVTGFVSMAVVLLLDPLAYPAAAALQVLALALLHRRLSEPALEWVGWLFALIYGGLLLLSGVLVNDPATKEILVAQQILAAKPFWDAPGMMLILPAAVLFAAGSAFGPGTRTRLIDLLDIAAPILAALGLGFVVLPNWFDLIGGTSFVAAAKLHNTELALALTFAAAGHLLGRMVVARSALFVVAGSSAGLMLFGLLLPLLQGWPLVDVPGNVYINILPVTFGTTAILVASTYALAESWGTVGIHPFARWAIYVLGLALMLAMGVLWIRFGFHGTGLQGEVFEAENYAYSVLLLVFGLVLLTGGIIFRSLPARAASFAFILATLAKAFLVDAQVLDGLLRVLSFFALGLSLLAVSWFYARFAFGLSKRPPTRPGPPSAGSGDSPGPDGDEGLAESPKQG